SCTEPHGPCVVDHPRSQPQTRFAHGEIPYRGLAAIAVRLRVGGSSCALRSACPTFRRLGSSETEGRIFFGRCSQGSGNQQTNPRATHAGRTGQIPFILFPEPTCGTCRSFAENRRR